MVGAGSIGSELLKLFALFEISSSPLSSLILYDRDTVEFSNLCNQSLYLEKDIGQYKANCAANRIKEKNTNLKITAISEKYYF